jgi:hypothetical protein
LRLAGAVGAGVWVEAGSDVQDPQFARVPADPRYPPQHQSAYEVRGISADRFARPGDFLVLVDRKAAGLPLRSGDIIMVTQVRGDMREVTARRFQGTAPNCALRFESTDARYGGPPLFVADLEQTDPTQNYGIDHCSGSGTGKAARSFVYCAVRFRKRSTGCVFVCCLDAICLALSSFPANSNAIPVCLRLFPCSVA